MAGNAKFGLSSGSPDEARLLGNCPDGQRAYYSGAHLDRPGSFRESNVGRSVSSGIITSKVSAISMVDSAPTSQCLMLEPITLDDQKYPRSVELRRALSISFGSASEDNSFGAAHSKFQPEMVTDDLEQFRANVLEANIKARNRAKRLDDSLSRLNKCCELNTKKQQIHDRSGVSNLSTVRNQSHRNPQDMMSQKLDERSKNAVPNKRVRTSLSDMRAEVRGNGISRQNLNLGKEKDFSKEGSLSSELVEEKNCRLPAGEGWDKNMKRKRSVSNVFLRPVDGDGELKQAMHGRLSNELGTQSSDAQNFRSGLSNCSTAANKPAATPSPASSSGLLTPENEMEEASLSGELAGMNKERIMQKGLNKSNMSDDSHLGSPSSVKKRKASRGPKTAATIAGNSSPSLQRISGMPEDWEQPMNASKGHSLCGVNSHKRPLPTESSSPPMAQWASQRPQKISRARRPNTESPTYNYDEANASSQGCTDSDSSNKISSGANGSLLARNVTNTTQLLKMKVENAPSPVRLSENEDSVAVENRLKDRAGGGAEAEERGVNGFQHAGPSGLLMKKNKLVLKEGSGDGVRRQGRSGRGSALSRRISALGEKLDNSAVPKPLRSMKPASDKSGSISGRRPLKKHLDRKGLTRLGPLTNCSSPDLAGESDDDQEELLLAAQFACSASFHACCSSFWKRMESIFFIRQEDKFYLKQQLKCAEEHQESLSQISGDKTMLHVFCEAPQSQSICSLGGKGLMNSTLEAVKLRDAFQDNIYLHGGTDYGERANNLNPLYQRVLSALIVEDEFEEYEENGCVRSSFLSGRDESCMLVDGVYCNGKTSYSGCSSNDTPDEIWVNKCSFMHNDAGASHASIQNELGGSQIGHINASGDLDCQYEQMCISDKLLLELQSVGLYPETVPDLAEGGDGLIDQDIVQLEQQLCHKIDKKKAHLEIVHKVVEEQMEAEARDHEQAAMDRLCELAYLKLLPTRGSNAARTGGSKVSKHFALAFIKRTLSRCRKFEDTGKSCFSEPPFRDVLAGPPSGSNGKAVDVISSCKNNHNPEAKISDTLQPATLYEMADALSVVLMLHFLTLNNRAAVCPFVSNSSPQLVEQLGSYPVGAEQLYLQTDRSDMGVFDSYGALSLVSDHAFAKNEPMPDRGKKKEVLLDDFGGSASSRPSTLGNTIVGGAKGKRNERGRDKDLSRNAVAKATRPSVSNLRGERKAKSKPKQKVTQLSTYPVGPSASGSGELVANGSSRKPQGLTATGDNPDSSNEREDILDFSNFPMPEFDTVDELDMENEFAGHQDLSSWLNFDDENLQDHDSMGLEIPMDDLSELRMLHNCG